MVDIRHIVVRNETARYRASVPQGCDRQGRIPEAAPAIEDEPRNARPLPWYVAELVGVPPAIVTSLAVVMTIIGAVGALHWWLS